MRISLPISSVVRVATWLALLAVVLGWVLLFRPTTLGGPAHYVLVSGTSMEPTLDGGDLVVLRQQSAYSPGDIVAFRVPEGDASAGRIVIHRVVSDSPDDGLTTQGDNMDIRDPWRPSQNDVLGKMWFRVPYFGRFLDILQVPAYLAAAAAVVTLFLILSGPDSKRAGPRRTPSAVMHRDIRDTWPPSQNEEPAVRDSFLRPPAGLVTGVQRRVQVASMSLLSLVAAVALAVVLAAVAAVAAR